MSEYDSFVKLAPDVHVYVDIMKIITRTRMHKTFARYIEKVLTYEFLKNIDNCFMKFSEVTLYLFSQDNYGGIKLIHILHFLCVYINILYSKMMRIVCMCFRRRT